MTSLLRTLCLLPLCLVLVTGCSGGASDAPTTYTVSGKVTLDGKPLPKGDIVFEAVDPTTSNSYAGRIENGSYRFESTPGPKRVKISSIQDVPGEFEELNPGERNPVRREVLPPTYHEKTTLEATVTADGPNTFDFELTSGG